MINMKKYRQLPIHKNRMYGKTSQKHNASGYGYHRRRGRESYFVELVRGYKNLPQKFKVAQTQCIRIDYSVLQ